MNLRKNLKALTLLLGSALFAVSCEFESSSADFAFERPAEFPEVSYNNPNNKVTKAGFELGRKLFYEKALSLDSSLSCGSCHHQSNAFSDPGNAFSTGVHGKLGLRNTPGLFNLAWLPTFMADGGINHLDIMPMAPITDSLEMDLSLMEAVNRIAMYADYKKDAEAAFGSDSITSQTIFYALSQFMRMMISDQSRFDQFYRGNASFSKEELAGLELFNLNCSTCHATPLFTDFRFAKNGLDPISEDKGRGRITQNEADYGKFKVPSLRNVALTAPYMHDGRFETLSEVIEHYSENINPENADAPLSAPLGFTEEEKKNLEAFLRTLTDESFIANHLFSDPNL